MTVSAREKRLILIAAPVLALALLLMWSPSSNNPAPNNSDSIGSTPLAEKRIAVLHKIAAAIPAREAVMRQTALDLSDRERGVIQAETAAQAQASLIEIARRVGKVESLDIRASDFPQPKPFGEYGLVYATITFDCHIDQLVNFVASLAKQPELVVPSEERINSGNPKDKTMGVRMILAGVVNKKLVPQKKGLGAF